MRLMIVAAVAALAFASTAEAKTAAKTAAAKPAATAMASAKTTRCKDAKGHFVKCPAPAATTAASGKAAMASTMPMKPAAKTRAAPAKCKTGVPCGNSCIPKGKVCHKS